MSKDVLFNKINEIIKSLKIKEDIVNKLNLNILVFNFKNKSIEAIYNGEYFNPYKYTVLL